MSCRWIIPVLLAASFPFATNASGQSVPRQVPRSVLQESAGEFQQGKVADAEKTLREALKQAPNDPAALGLLGVILDAQKRYGEAEKAYKQALALVPNSLALLNNLGNHYLAEGKLEEARAAFLRTTEASRPSRRSVPPG